MIRNPIHPNNQDQVNPETQTHFQIHAPRATHHGVLTCREAECADYLTGFVVDCPPDDPKAQYIEGAMNQGEPAANRRQFKKTSPMPGMVRFWFPPGTRCFREHRGVVREGIFTIRPGLGKLSTVRPEVWRDDMQEELVQLKELRRREGFE